MSHINRCYQILLLTVIFALVEAVSQSSSCVTVIYLSLSQFCSEASGVQLYFLLFAVDTLCSMHCSTLVFHSEHSHRTQSR